MAAVRTVSALAFVGVAVLSRPCCARAGAARAEDAREGARAVPAGDDLLRPRPVRQGDRGLAARLPREGRPGFLYNIAQAYRRRRTPQKAIFFYKGYLRNSPKAHNRAEVEQKIAALQKQIDGRGAAAPRTRRRRPRNDDGAAAARDHAAAGRDAPPPAVTTPPASSRRWRRPRRRPSATRRPRRDRGGRAAAAAGSQPPVDVDCRDRRRLLVIGGPRHRRTVVRVHARRSATRFGDPGSRYRFRMGGALRLHLPGPTSGVERHVPVVPDRPRRSTSGCAVGEAGI